MYATADVLHRSEQFMGLEIAPEEQQRLDQERHNAERKTRENDGERGS
ncbi:hypothetical protein [Roseovarius sp. MMSF_3281]|nr:hypothetical protein [Roseovarius sp. MMSF_3281]